jgi:hypothetical protein
MMIRGPVVRKLAAGSVLFSKAGMELVSVCWSAPVPGFLEYTTDRWKAEGLQIAELAQSPEVVQ